MVSFTFLDLMTRQTVKVGSMVPCEIVAADGYDLIAAPLD